MADILTATSIKELKKRVNQEISRIKQFKISSNLDMMILILTAYMKKAGL